MEDTTNQQRAFLGCGQAFTAARRQLNESGHSLTCLIMAAIADGAVTRDDIIRSVPKGLAYGYAFVAHELDAGTSPDPSEGCWFRDHSRQYHLHCMPGTAVPADDVPAAARTADASAGVARTLSRRAKQSRRRQADLEHLIQSDIPF